MADTTNRRGVAWAAALDVVAAVVFVAIGRRNHDESGSMLTGTLKVAAPFLIALVIGWLAARAWRSPASVESGIIIWLVTVSAGMLLRKFAFDGGTALPFIIVASLFTLLFLVGWRGIAQLRTRRSDKRQ
jgi:uncharacterized membrane protein YbjE (DUF340 family)